MKHRAACVARSCRTCSSKRPREQWLRELEAAGIPCSPVNTLGELSAHPHTRESGMVFDYDATLKGVAPAVRVDGDRPGERNPPPKLGATVRDALRIAGYSQEEIDAMVRDKIVASADSGNVGEVAFRPFAMRMRCDAADTQARR